MVRADRKFFDKRKLDGAGKREHVFFFTTSSL